MSGPDTNIFYGDILIEIDTIDIKADTEVEDHPSLRLHGRILKSKKDGLPKDFPMRIALARDPGDQGLSLNPQGGFARWPTTQAEAKSLVRLIKLNTLSAAPLSVEIDVADAQKLAPTLQEQHIYDLNLSTANLINAAD